MRGKIRITLIILFTIYNILGTIVICSSYGSDPLYGDWVIPLSTITFPINFFSFVYRFVSEPIFPVFIIQGIIQLIGVRLILLLTKSNK